MADPAALELLDRSGPFIDPRFRNAFVRAYPEWRDVSFGGTSADGTRAAVALLADRSGAVSMPFTYGGVVATRTLTRRETADLLDLCRRKAGARRLVVRAVALGAENAGHLGSRVVGWTSVVPLDRGTDLQSRWAPKARRSIRIAQLGGATAAIGDDPQHFLRLYAGSSDDHWLRFPASLVGDLARGGLARCYDVWTADGVVSSILVLTSAGHWIAWLAAQDEHGRALNGNYLAVASLLEDAQRAGVRAVNLGSSTGLPGVAHFKRRFAAVETPIVEHRVEAGSVLRGRVGALVGEARQRGRRRGARAGHRGAR